MVLDKEAASVACNHLCRLYVLWDPTFLNQSGQFAKVTLLPSWGGFSFSFLGPAHESFHSPEQSFHSHQWVVGKQFHGWPPNQYQAVLFCILSTRNVLGLRVLSIQAMENTHPCCTTQICFSGWWTSNPHLANLSAMYKKQRTQNQTGGDLSLPIDYVIRILVI